MCVCECMCTQVCMGVFAVRKENEFSFLSHVSQWFSTAWLVYVVHNFVVFRQLACMLAVRFFYLLELCVYVRSSSGGVSDST